MASNYPQGIDDIALPLPTEPLKNQHREVHQKISDSIIALQQNVATKLHNHGGGTQGPKLDQVNTHESNDIDSSAVSLHHSIGNSANQYSRAGHSHSPQSIGLNGNNLVINGTASVINPQYTTGPLRFFAKGTTGNITSGVDSGVSLLNYTPVASGDKFFFGDSSTQASEGFYQLSFDYKTADSSGLILSFDGATENITTTTSWQTYNSVKPIRWWKSGGPGIASLSLALSKTVSLRNIRLTRVRKPRDFITVSIAGVGYQTGVDYYYTSGLSVKDSSPNYDKFFRIYGHVDGNATLIRVIKSGYYTISGSMKWTYTSRPMLTRAFHAVNVWDVRGDLKHRIRYSQEPGDIGEGYVSIPEIYLKSGDSIAFGNFTSTGTSSYAGGSDNPTSRATIEFMREAYE